MNRNHDLSSKSIYSKDYKRENGGLEMSPLQEQSYYPLGLLHGGCISKDSASISELLSHTTVPDIFML